MAVLKMHTHRKFNVFLSSLSKMTTALDWQICRHLLSPLCSSAQKNENGVESSGIVSSYTGAPIPSFMNGERLAHSIFQALIASSKVVLKMPLNSPTHHAEEETSHTRRILRCLMNMDSIRCVIRCFYLKRSQSW